LLSTGNFNEGTAQLYTDHMLLTANKDIVRELELLFLFFGFRKQPDLMNNGIFDQLWVAQFNLQEKLLLQIDKEIKNKNEGKEASIIIKLNSLEDKVLINKLYEASSAGVTINLIVRSICCLIPGLEGVSENIKVTRIVDRYLEHGRIFVFQNGGDLLMYMGSADWMNRSMYHRIEVCFPIYDQAIKQQVLQMLEIQLADNLKAVVFDNEMKQIRKTKEILSVRSQENIYHLLNS
jgi:polyphosphate kinase